MFGVRRIALAVVAVFVLAGCASTVSGTAQPVSGGSGSFAGPPIPVVAAAGGEPVAFDPGTATVLVGASTAKHTVDLYEDLLCPICGTFEKQNDADLDNALAVGTIAIRYHLLDLLDQNTNPPGYSLLAANAALAVAATTRRTSTYLNSLFAHQPAEQGAGYTADQLIDLGRRLGVTGSRFAALVRDRQYASKIRANLTAAEHNPALDQPGLNEFGTPTVVVDGKVVSWQQPDWLAAATG